MMLFTSQLERTNEQLCLPVVGDLMLNECRREVSGLFQFVGFEALDEVWGLGGQAVDQSADGDLELGPSRGGPASGRPPGIS